MDHNTEGNKAKLEKIKNAIKSYPDFPKTGILFRDIFPIFGNPDIFDDLIIVTCDAVKSHAPNASVIVGIESRGFLLAPIIAHKLHLPFVPVRKVGKLPGPTQTVKYDLEYGSDTLQIQDSSISPDADVVIVDDLLATGGTMQASSDLVHLLKAKVALILVIVELTELNGRKNLKAPVVSLVQY